MGNYRLSGNAADDLYRIWLYGLERWGLEQANTYYDAFMQHFAELANNPQLHPTVDDIRQGYRRSVCGSDSVYYRVADQARDYGDHWKARYGRLALRNLKIKSKNCYVVILAPKKRGLVPAVWL